jgi:dTDP-4-dehydrorhamnose 3,5-epimerase
VQSALGVVTHKQSICLFVNQGHLKAVLYDGRENSATYGMINEVLLGDTRPAFLVIPIGVWHGMQNLGTCDVLVLNHPSQAYNYQDPDHWRLPYDIDKIPYKWVSRGAATRPRADAR